MMICAALVFFMTPGLAFFYGGLVRRKNVCNTIMACVAIMGLSVVMWTLFGYSLSFGGNHAGIIGDFRWFGLNGVGLMNTQAMFLGNEYLVLLINTKPEDCQEIQKRIDAQFRKKDTVYEIRYSVKSVRSLNNAKDDQSLS